MLDRIQELIDDKIKPALATHGGDIELVDLDNKKLFIILKGGCQGCSSAKVTVKDGIERLVMYYFPDLVDEIVDLTDHAAGENPYM